MSRLSKISFRPDFPTLFSFNQILTISQTPRIHHQLNTFWMCGGIIKVFVGSVDGWWLGNSKTELRKSGSPVGRAALEKNQTEIVTVAQEEVWKRRSLPTKDWKTAFPQNDQVHPSSCNRLSLSFSFQQDHQWWRYHRRLLVYQSLYF